ncbi:hypothetical protein SUGI_0333270 [Cryptomeria japonica]|uniref:uncharacterized protein LOC131035592 n=1 Tax=Cryptomeria japonica TaxID=3369 RepID=UPI002408B98D|nr:uncharacterized protein LOC131035592 [Cryptomeria japonica]GLJ18681.1 hypothetical protein SUGI_0333270 [Cryptomeria japonica]
MELNLSSSVTHNLTAAQESCGQLLEGLTPRVQLRETRSAYFINVNLSGFRKEDIRLEMDNTRTLIIRGHRYLQGMGKVEWTWHLMESGGRSFRKPFRIPQNVNVGAMTGTFHQGVLHVLMPKFRWTSRFTPYNINRSDAQDDQALEEAAQEEAKENAGGSHGAEKVEGYVGTQSSEDKDGHGQKPPEISRVEEKSNLNDTHLQQERIKEVAAAAASTPNDKTEETVQQHQPATAPDLHHHEKPSFLDSKGDFVGTQSNEEKDGHDQKPPEISTVKGKSNLDDNHLQQEGIDEVGTAVSKSCDNTEEPVQQHQPETASDLHHHEKPSCLDSKGEAGEEVAENVVEDMGILTDHKEKDEQKDALNVLAEEVIAQLEIACPLNSEAEKDSDDAKPEPETVISSNGIDDYSGIISDWNYGETFWSRRKIVVALLVSSVAAIAAFKLMRR